MSKGIPAANKAYKPDPWAVSERDKTAFGDSEVLFLIKDQSFGMLSMASVLEHQGVSKVRAAGLSPEPALLMYPPPNLTDLGGDLEAKLFQERYLSMNETYQLARIQESGATNKLVFLSMDADNIDLVSKTVALSRVKCPSAEVVVGGSAVTLNPEGSLGYSGADFGVMGEGERTLPALVGLLARFPREERPGNREEFLRELRDIPNVFMRDGRSVVASHKNGGFISIHELENQPLNYDLLGEILDGSLPLITSRGCPYKCGFCLGQLLFGSKVRAWSPGKIMRELHKIDELEYVHDGYAQEFTFERFGKFKINNILLWDADFLFDRDRAMDFFNGYSESDLKDRFTFCLQAGVDSLKRGGRPDARLINAMAKANVKSVSLGAENLSDSFIGRHKAPHRFNTRDIMDESCALSDAGIIPELYLIITDLDVTPPELRESFTNLRDLAGKADKLGICMTSRIIPYPATATHADIQRRGLQEKIRTNQRPLADGTMHDFIHGVEPVHEGAAAFINELDLKKNRFSGKAEIQEFCERALNLVDKHSG